jgi:hypothetical protein
MKYCLFIVPENKTALPLKAGLLFYGTVHNNTSWSVYLFLTNPAEPTAGSYLRVFYTHTFI